MFARLPEGAGRAAKRRGGYRPIGDYALIGDTNTAALVASDGAIDWCCWPRIDSPAVFCRLLDAAKGGYFSVGPTQGYEVRRTYLGDTNVLATTFTTLSGRVRLTDFMPVGTADSEAETPTTTSPILRLVEGLEGETEVEVRFRPTFDYARAETQLVPCQDGALAQAGAEQLALVCPCELRPAPEGGLVGTRHVAAGERVWFALTYSQDGWPPGHSVEHTPLSPAAAEAALTRTLKYWEDWSARCTYVGPYHPLVRRSALALKLLTYAPTGALVAAPTTSLPEEIGGVRNWDYRYTWLRDSALILYALQGIGYHAEANDFFVWLQQLCLRGRERLQIMYTIDGQEHLPEQVLGHMEGYRGSRPVRVGNAAAGQTQLDVYGEVLDAAHLHLTAMPAALDRGFGDVLRLLADRAAARWQEADQGIWEVRGGPRHFLYSKLLCWVALDRAVRLSEEYGLAGDVARWRLTRESIRQTILTRGYDANLGAFTQALGEPVLDASALAIPLFGFLPPTDPRVRSTVERVREHLSADGLVYRYLADDGLPGGEGTFALCTFWLVDNLALGGRIEEARALFERVTTYASDLGLMAEEIAPREGLLLGNYPQGFTHLALIRSALNIAEAETHGVEESARTPAERGQRAASAGKHRRD